MPNTLAHIAIGGILSKSALRNPDLKLVYMACVIPDVPWIIQRIVKSTGYDFDLYDLRAYFIVQASLLSSILLCISIALLTRKFWQTFVVLGLGCVIHLVLDATQIKWANGVHFFAPFDWKMSRFDFLWPDNPVVYFVTFLGLIYFLIHFKETIQSNGVRFLPKFQNAILSFVFFIAWVLIPVIFIPTVYSNNNHFIDTLKYEQRRSDKPIEMDRNRYISIDGVEEIKTAFGETIKLQNMSILNNSTVSIQGLFIDKELIYVHKFHVHNNFRDYASMIGLSLIAGLWLIFLLRTYIPIKRSAFGSPQDD